MGNTRTYRQPVQHAERISSRRRLKSLMHLLPMECPEEFDPACISWVTDYVGITAADGVDQAIAEGCYVINVAAEIENQADSKMPVEPYSGAVQKGLDLVANLIQKVSDQDRQVVVHCAMGMERSALAVVWYLHSRKHYSIDESYSEVMSKRPIVLDRRGWIGT